jgi:3-methyladenine DNA glycosylase AlkC
VKDPVKDTAQDPAGSADEASKNLKEIFNEARLRHIAAETRAVYRAFDDKAFVRSNLAGLEELSIMQRLRRVAQTLHDGLPADYPRSLEILRQLAPRLNSRFVTMALPEYVACYGAEDFDASMQALKFFTGFGSSEFAVRPFLLREPARTLKVMRSWAKDDDEHVRRLASEGSRPRLPWSFRIPALIADPTPVLPILASLNADPSLYVRKSVANHLNDISKDHPDWVMDVLESWPRHNPHTGWIARHALRTLIKKGDRRALGLVGAGEKAQVRLGDVQVTPQSVTLGGRISLSFVMHSTAKRAQRLVVDYAIHYVKKAGAASPKVFKWKTFDLQAGGIVRLAREQAIRDFTTRTHYAGRHEVDILVNGECLARTGFTLRT